jgi:hypothetical protein
LPASVSYSRPIFMRFRDFDFETAIWDCRSAVMMNQRQPQSDVASIERFLGLATTRILCRHLASFSPTEIATSVSQPPAPRFTHAPASEREHDRRRKPRFPRKLGEVWVGKVARTPVAGLQSGATWDQNSYQFTQFAVMWALATLQWSVGI